MRAIEFDIEMIISTIVCHHSSFIYNQDPEFSLGHKPQDCPEFMPTLIPIHGVILGDPTFFAAEYWAPLCGIESDEKCWSEYCVGCNCDSSARITRGETSRLYEIKLLMRSGSIYFINMCIPCYAAIDIAPMRGHLIFALWALGQYNEIRDINRHIILQLIKPL